MKFKDAVEEIKNRVSIVDVINQYITLHRSGNNYIGLCPFHNEKTPSFSVNESKKIFKCFGCNKGGNVYTFLQDYLNITFPEAVKMLANKCNIEIEDEYNKSTNFKEIEEKKQSLYNIYKEVANSYYKILHSELGKPGYEYFKKRNLTDETIKKFGLGYAPNGYGYMYNLMKEKGYSDALLLESKLFKLHNDKPVDFFYNRVMFPLVDVYGHVIGFQSRSLEPEVKIRKYLNSEESIIFNKSRFLYGMNFASKSNDNFLILCEGNMDAITINQAGLNNVVATMGTAFSSYHINLLKRKTKKIYLCQDTDDAGIKAIIKSANELNSNGFETYAIDFSPAKDADEFINKFGAEAFRKKIESPIPSFLFYISTLKKVYNLQDSYDYNNYVNKIVESIGKIENSIIRDNYIKKVAIQEELDQFELNSLVDKYLKGNTIKSSEEKVSGNIKVDISSKVTNDDNFNVEKFFIFLCYNLNEYRDKISDSIDENELNNEICRKLFTLFKNGMNLDDIYNTISSYDDSDKDIANHILNDKYEINEGNTENLLSSINQIIRHIKIFNLKKSSGNNLESVFEFNTLSNEINSKIYVK